MAKDRFFMIDVPFEQFDEHGLDQALRTSKHVCNVLYKPDRLEDRRIEGVAFENVSFSKTTLGQLTFKKCNFTRCLFIGTAFEGVEFHSCSIKECNFFKATFKDVYGKPQQFSKAVVDDKYANVAIHLYQGLRRNYASETQPEFMREAEFQFKRWGRKQIWNDLKRQPKNPKHYFEWLGSAIYGFTFGYGLRLRNLLLTTFLVVTLLSTCAQKFGSVLFAEGGTITVVKSIYFTISTMITLGAVGFTPISNDGYLYVILNAILGIVLLSATLNAFAKRVAR